jgi:serine/threonine-protein kinase RsbW
MSGFLSDPSERGADVEVTLPAEGAYVSVLRTTTAALAARLDFTLDDVEDVRMAVGEAASLVLAAADDGGQLIVRYWLDRAEVRVLIGTPCAQPTTVDEDSFAWQVLTTLAAAAVVPHDDRFELELVVAPTPLEVAP